MEKIVVTPEQAAEMLVTSPSEVRKWIHDGELPAYRSGRNWKIVKSQLQKFVEDKAEAETKERRIKKCRQSLEES